jgi:response regulator RpfG family c-di-GMP phosphodiesterase
VLDVGLPGIDGLFYCARLRENPTTNCIPIVAISGSKHAGAAAKAAGANQFVHKPFDPLELLTLLERAMGRTPLEHAFGAGVPDDEAPQNAASLRTLIEIGRQHHEELDRAYRDTLSALATSLEVRGLETGAHTARVTAYAMRLTVEVAPALTDDLGLEWGFMFHDVGNIGVPDRILLKRGSLKSDEWKLLQQHTTIGEQVLHDVPLLNGEGLGVVRSHHERWDGSGYPDQLSGDAIPIEARIIACCDTWNAMRTDRSYRKALSQEVALAELQNNSGTQLDPEVVGALLRVLELDS